MTRQRAFTLIELLVVILIVAILLAVAAPSFLGQQDKAHDSHAKQTVANSYRSGKASWVANTNAYPALGAKTDAAGTGSLFGQLKEFEPQYVFATSVSTTNPDQVQVTRHDDQVVSYAAMSRSGRVFCVQSVEQSLTVGAVTVQAGVYWSASTPVVPAGGGPVTPCGDPSAPPASTSPEGRVISDPLPIPPTVTVDPPDTDGGGPDVGGGTGVIGPGVVSSCGYAAPPTPRTMPTANAIVFTRQVGSYRQLFTVEPDGSALQQLTFSDANKDNPAWAPDKSQLVYDCAGDLYRMNADATGVLRVNSDGVALIQREAQFSPDATKLVYIAVIGSQEPVVTADAYGTNVTVLDPNAGATTNSVNNKPGVDTSPRFSADGNSIAFLKCVPWSDCMRTPYAMSTDGSNLRQTIGLAGSGKGVDFLNATTLVYAAPRGSTNCGAYYAGQQPGLKTTALSSNVTPPGNTVNNGAELGTVDVAARETDPDMSPAGTQLVYARQNSCTTDSADGLWIVGADGLGRVKVPNTLYQDASPSW